MNIELLTSQVFNPETDLLILDEIGECERAVTSLKYFAEKAPSYFVAASGSNVGLLNTFPVGQVEQYNLRPLTFQEFIHASAEKALIKAFDTQVNSAAVHSKLMDKLTDYLFTGGMPEAVAAWYQNKDVSMLKRVDKVSKIQTDLVEGYRRDFGKYAGKVDATLIEAVFNGIAAQLSLVSDQSVKRFKFKNVHERKSRYSDFETAIHWLKRCRLALANYPIEGQPKLPLAAYKKENMVKIFCLTWDCSITCWAVATRKSNNKAMSTKAMLQKTLCNRNSPPLVLIRAILGTMLALKLSLSLQQMMAILFRSKSKAASVHSLNHWCLT